MPFIGAILIGQSPRPDLIKPLQAVNRNLQFIESGALDFVTAADIPSQPQGDYLLTTRLRDGTLVEVDEAFLLPLLQQAITNAERQGAQMCLLMCAGPFDALIGQKPLYKPTAMAHNILSMRGVSRIAVLSPNLQQVDPIRTKWRARGYEPVMLVDPGLPDAQLAEWIRQQLHFTPVEYLLLDYVGHPLSKVQAIEHHVGVPVLDFSKLLCDMLKHMTL